MDEEEEDDLIEYIVTLRQQIAALHWMENEVNSLLQSIAYIAHQLQERESLFEQIQTWGNQTQLSQTGNQVLLDDTWVSIYTAIERSFKVFKN